MNWSSSYVKFCYFLFPTSTICGKIMKSFHVSYYVHSTIQQQNWRVIRNGKIVVYRQWYEMKPSMEITCTLIGWLGWLIIVSCRVRSWISWRGRFINVNSDDLLANLIFQFFRFVKNFWFPHKAPLYILWIKDKFREKCANL